MTISIDVIVIGGGPAGVTAALRARELGAEVALVERGPLGGTCTNDGCLPTRVLARAARLARDARQLADLRLIGEPPQVDVAQLMTHTQEMIYTVHEKKQLLHHLRDAGVDVFAGIGQRISWIRTQSRWPMAAGCGANSSFCAPAGTPAGRRSPAPSTL